MDGVAVASDSVIRCTGLACGYGEKIVIRDVNVVVPRGKIVALVGGSGCGKSTLLKTLVGLLPPLAGQVSLLDVDPYSLEGPQLLQLLRRTGNVFQHGALFSGQTVGDNLALPVREFTALPAPVVDEMVRMKLALVGLDGFEHRMPSELSGGQRKRVALARASMLDPELIFCDEPSAGLDPVAAAELDLNLKRFRDLFGMSVVIVTHELASIAEIADHIVMLGRGSVLSEGSYDTMRTSDVPEVHDFFHRVGSGAAGSRRSVLDDLNPPRESP